MNETFWLAVIGVIVIIAVALFAALILMNKFKKRRERGV
jgi:L-asparagine transporter-like permease